MKILLLAFIFGFGTNAAGAATIAAHRAVYDLKLLRLGAGAALSNVEGRLAFEIQGSTCEDWSVSFRMVNQFWPAEGEVKTVDTQSTSYESGDGLEMRYNQKEFINRALQSEERIRISRAAVDSEAKGELGEEGTAPFTLQASAVFPMQHQLKLMQAAETGATRDTSVIYDGSDGENAFRAITFIGKRKSGGENRRDLANREAAALSGLASWPVTISYYKAAEGGGDTPEYQVSFDLYENGVATGLVLDYSEFVLGGNLAKLELLGGEPCN